MRNGHLSGFRSLNAVAAVAPAALLRALVCAAAGAIPANADAAPPTSQPAAASRPATAASRPDAATERPLPLLAVEKARSRIQRAHVEWTLRIHARDLVRHYTSQSAFGDRLCLNRGDDQGVTGTLVHDDSPVNDSVGRLRTRDGDTWQCMQALGAERGFELLTDFLEVLAVDLDPSGAGQLDVHDALWKPRGAAGLAGPRYTAEVRDGLHVVTARYDEKERVHEFVWWLDPAKDWSPVRLERRLNGKVTSDTRIVPKRWGDTWFPESVVRFRADYRGGRAPYATITIDAARFNAPDLPERLTPAQIGVDIGTAIVQKGKEREPQFWDGGKAVSRDEFRRRVEAGEIPVHGPRLRQALDRADARLAELGLDASLASQADNQQILRKLVNDTLTNKWERRVKAFAESYELTAEQRASAAAILRDVRRRAADEVIDWTEVDRYDDVLAKWNRTPKGKERDPIHEEGRRIVSRTYAVLAELLDHELMPRLEALLTESQRAREAAPPPAAASAPGDVH